MPLDAVCLSAVVNELSEALRDARVDKVQQPERDELIISLRTKQENVKLLVSAGTGDARIHFTNSSYENPAQPPSAPSAAPARKCARVPRAPSQCAGR